MFVVLKLPSLEVQNAPHLSVGAAWTAAAPTAAIDNL